MTEEIVYKCDHCDEGFTLEESDRIYEDGQPVTVCPNCGSADIEEGGRCKVCRGIEYTFNLSHGACKGCMQDAKDAYQAKLRELEPWVIELLEAEYGPLDITERS